MRAFLDGLPLVLGAQDAPVPGIQFVGLFGGEFTIPTALLTLKIITIRGSFVGSLDELVELVALAKRGALPQIPTIGAELSAEAVQQSLDRLAAGGVPGRIVLSAS